MKKRQSIIKGHKEIENKSLLDIKGYLKKRYRMNNQHKSFLVLMLMRSGDKNLFWITTDDPTFEKDKQTYIIDMECAGYEATNKTYLLIYHQDISLPLNIKVDASLFYDNINNIIGENLEDTDIKKLLTDSKYITYNIVPSVLNHVLNSDVIKKIIQGESLTDTLYMVKMLMVYTAITVSIGGIAGIITLFFIMGI